MTDKTTDPLLLADWLQHDPLSYGDAAADALRRLHKVNAQLLEALDQLHEATHTVSCGIYDEEYLDISLSKARAAIAAARGQA